MPRSGVALALVAAVFFGVSGVVAADAFAEVDPVQLAQIRSVGAALILGAVAYRRRDVSTGGRLGELAALGGVLAVVTVAFYVAIDRLGVGPGVTVQFLGPVVVLVWMAVVQGRPVPPFAWGGAAMAVGGTALVNRAWDLGVVDPVGIVAGAVAAVAFAAYLILGERLGRRLSGLSVTAHGFAFSGLIWVVMAPVSVPSVSTRVWLELAWVVVGGTAVPFLLEIAAVRRADAGRVGVAATSEPAVAALVAWMVLGQALTVVQLVGVGLVVAGVATIQFLTASVAPDVPPDVI